MYRPGRVDDEGDVAEQTRPARLLERGREHVVLVEYSRGCR